MNKSSSIKRVPDFYSLEFLEKKNKYCLCIPVLNELGRINVQLEKMKKRGIDKIIDIAICDGCSTDGSTNSDMLKQYGVNTLLRLDKKIGQSAQMRMGFWWALERGYEGIISIDGNNKDSIEDIPKFIDKLEEGYDFIQGSRFLGKQENTPMYRFLAIRLIHAPIISITAGYKFTDTTNGFKGYSKKYLTDSRVQPFRDIFKTYEILDYLTARAGKLKLKVCEIPVTRRYPSKKVYSTKLTFFRGNILLLKILLSNFLGKYNP